MVVTLRPALVIVARSIQHCHMIEKTSNSSSSGFSVVRSVILKCRNWAANPRNHA